MKGTSYASRIFVDEESNAYLITEKISQFDFKAINIETEKPYYILFRKGFTLIAPDKEKKNDNRAG